MAQYPTFKNGRYTGTGDYIGTLVWGDHAPRNSPFSMLPVHASQLEMFLWNLNLCGYVAAQWTETLVDVGSGTTSFAPSAGGLLLTGAGNEDDGGQTQMLRAFTPAAGKTAVFYCRMQCSEATQYDWRIGWANTDTSVIASAPTHGATLHKEDGDTIVNGASNDGGTESDTANLITNFAAATEYDFGIVVNGVTNVTFHYKLASAADWNMVAKTTDLPTDPLRATFAGLNGEATADTMTISRAMVAWTL
jgi:hypothetical protein